MTSDDVTFYPGEEWLELPGFPPYLVSTHGRYYNVPRRRMLRTKMVKSGNVERVRVQLTPSHNSGTSVSRTVAVDVLDLFGADDGKVRKGAGHIPGYLDGDVRNCHIDNLEWVWQHSPEHAAALARYDRFERGRMLAEAAAEAVPGGGLSTLATGSKSNPAKETRTSARPGGLVTADGVRAAMASRRTDKDLTADERKAVREWWIARGGSKRGRIPADAIMAYDHEAGLGVGA